MGQSSNCSACAVKLWLHSPFPGYWAFTGGGVSRVDGAAVESFSVLDVEHGKFIACILRETCEELGVAPNGDHVISIDENARFDVIKDKANWLPHAEDCNIPVNIDNINILGHWDNSTIWTCSIR